MKKKQLMMLTNRERSPTLPVAGVKSKEPPLRAAFTSSPSVRMKAVGEVSPRTEYFPVAKMAMLKRVAATDRE